MSKLTSPSLPAAALGAVDVALILGVDVVVPAHFEGWSIYTEGLDELGRAFDDAGVVHLLRIAPLGTWTLATPAVPH